MTRPLNRARPKSRRARTPSKKPQAREGFALLLSLVAIAILAVMITDLHETTSMGFAAANAQRDRMRAEYMAKSGLNLTRMLLGQEPAIRKLVDPIYRVAMQGRRAPQIPVWLFANTILKPFSDLEGSKEDVAAAGFDLDMAEGLGNTHGTFEVAAVAENGKVNINTRSLRDTAGSQAQVAMLLYSLLGGSLPSPNKYDPLFSQLDENGRLTTRLDVVSNVIDWWDFDEQRTQFDPALATVTAAGGEDTSYYSSLPTPYAIKNAPLDTLEELRLVRGITDDVWATFVEPDPENPQSRQVTIYGGGNVNPNEAEPVVLLARVCAFPELQKQLLCADPTGLEPMKFIQLISMARGMAQGVPWFSRGKDFVDFVTGDPEGLYGRLSGLLQMMGSQQLLFTPITIPESPATPDLARTIRRSFTTRAQILTIEVTGTSGNAQTRIRSVLQRDTTWVPPPPNSGAMPPLGIFYYYRID